MSKYNLPPEAYADLLCENEQVAQPALNLLLSDWKALVGLESNAKHQALANDLRVAVAPPVRLSYQLFEHGQQESGKKLLKGMLLVIPDSKLIEDIHGRVRNDARANISKSQTFNQIQQVILGSSALESRGINHPAAVSKSVFKRRWKQTNGKRNFKAAFISKTEKLPKKYSRLLGSKSWGAMTEKSLHRSAAAWTLVRHFVQQNLREQGLRLQDSWINYYTCHLSSLSVLFFKAILLINKIVVEVHSSQDALLALVLRAGMVFRLREGGSSADGTVYLCVANVDWAVLAWPLKVQEDALLDFDSQGKLSWHFVWSLDQYEAGVAEPVLNGDNCISLKPVEEWQSAVVCMLGSFSADLVFRELATLAERGLGIERPNRFTREQLLREIAMKATSNSEFADKVVANEEAAKKKRKSAQEEAESDEFAEMLLENMDMDDAAEFKKEKNIGRKEQMAKKKKWPQWRRDALNESWLHLDVFVFFCKTQGSPLKVVKGI